MLLRWFSGGIIKGAKCTLKTPIEKREGGTRPAFFVWRGLLADLDRSAEIGAAIDRQHQAGDLRG
jgi:hypothetical protein